MALIQPQKRKEPAKYRIEIDGEVGTEIASYQEYAGFDDNSLFFEAAAKHVLEKDKGFAKWKKDKKKENKSGAESVPRSEPPVTAAVPAQAGL
ncbi:MAG: hypothetical protein GYB26_10090 [Gammaproteobacteria bacterium]|nr:hypothetical protein [Gammaproteobacteria bacterium]